jgi:type III secretory pathway component EscR
MQHISARLKTTEYAAMDGAPMKMPKDSAFQPYREFLSKHAAWARLG